MKIYFDTDPATGAVRFHHEAILGLRQIPTWKSAKEQVAGKRPVMIDNPSCRIPVGATEIPSERFAELMAAQREGAEIVLGRNGNPVAVPRPINPEERRAARRLQRDRLLAASDWTQLPDSPLSSSERAAWGEYRQQLRDLEMDGEGWPEAPGGSN